SLISLLIAAALVLLKDAAAYKQTDKAIPWMQAFLHPVGDPLWWATSIAALATAFGTLYAVYAANPAWGSGGFTDIASLIAAGFAAVGGATILSTLTPS
ncbi:MAG TPA: hypothetical protein VNY33_08880, partial [Gaiellaceae bacterium]|nr:hypothetical protein [Gaiellaceae bacterium]